MKQMTEKEAWLKYAQLWAAPVLDLSCGDEVRYGVMVPSYWGGEQVVWGLCDTLDESRDLGDGVYGNASDRLSLFKPNGKGYSDFWWDGSLDAAVQRTWACLFLAAMCD